MSLRMREAATHRSFLVALDVPVLVIGSRLEILASNDVAERWLRDGERLRVRGQQLDMPEGARSELERAMREAAETRRPQAWDLERQSFLVRALDGCRETAFLDHPTVWSVTVAYGAEEAPARAVVPGLTPAERKFAEVFAELGHVHATAQRLGIRLSTARTHLKRIREKAGVESQAQLVRLLTDARR
jgi:DNA-binding CsgD family transcriptional regulator